jgi:four helix bundle protein
LALNAHRVATEIRGPHYASMRSQIIRSAMSIPANIVEGREQRSDPGFARFLRIALGSTSELDYHLRVAIEINAISVEDHTSLSAQVVDVRMMLHGLLRRIEREIPGRKGRPDKSVS